MDGQALLAYIEPIFRFCCQRLSNRYEAEDLASEIVLHALEGMKKYEIVSLEAWVWRIAHNRYARWIDGKNRNPKMLSLEDTCMDIEDDTGFDEESAEMEYEAIFHSLHTLCSDYKNIFVDHYLREYSVRALSEKYGLPETTVKWRLNVGRQKIKDRIGEECMNKIYTRIHWNTTACNGNLDADRYLHTQMARAICLAAYEKPLAVEEISMATGIPTMYIEDEIPRLIYGDAIRKIGNKYAADFIIFRKKDRTQTEKASETIVKLLSDKIETLFCETAEKISAVGFYGNDFGIERLGYIFIPYLLRKKIRKIKMDRLHLENGAYPQRKDGGYGWFLVSETEDENEDCADEATGCNTAENKFFPAHIYYYWIFKYFHSRIYHDKGIRFLCEKGIPHGADGRIPHGSLYDEDIAQLIESGLAYKDRDGYRVNFACFTEKQFKEVIALLNIENEEIEKLLADYIVSLRKSFEAFVPVRLHEQINQFLSVLTGELVGYVIAELTERGVLRKPDTEKPLTDGVFYAEGKYINP